MNSDKWIWIFLMVMVVSMASCEGYLSYNKAQVEIAQLECQQNNVEVD